MSTGEIITIQCGHFSNFIGTHWWNIQSWNQTLPHREQGRVSFRDYLPPPYPLSLLPPVSLVSFPDHFSYTEGKNGLVNGLFRFIPCSCKEAGFCYDDSFQGSQEILHNCTFREGLTLTGEQTYTPRLIALDLPGSLKTLKKGGVLYENTAVQDSPLWEGKVETHVTDPPQKNAFLTDLDRMDTGEMEEEEVAAAGHYDLDAGVEVWSDFLRTQLHSRSLLMIPGYFHNGPDGSFDMYPAGMQVWEKRKFRHAFEDQLHFFLEECDHLQGFQLLVDWDSGFGAVASALAQEVEDEFGAKGFMALAATPLAQPLDKTPTYWTTLLNNALTLDSLCTHCSAFCPLSLLTCPWRTHSSSSLTTRIFPHLDYKPSLPYHSSAIMASALDTATLLYRTEHSPTTLPSLLDSLTTMGRKVCSMGVSLPLSLPPGSSLLAELDHAPLHSILQPLTPFCTPGDVKWAQAITVRGIPPSYPLCSVDDPRSMQCHDPSHAIASHLAEQSPAIQSLFSVVQKPLPVCSPFPTVLPSNYGSSKEAPMCASLHSQSGVWQLLTSLLSELKSTAIRRFPGYASTCLDPDSLSELLHSLAALADSYQTDTCPEESSDSED